jgi:hypothetical protein
MHSPFPGMDPYLEDASLWPEFHRRLVAVLDDLLAAGLRDRYQVTTGQRRYAVERPTQGPEQHQEDYLEVRQRDGGLVTLLDVVSPANKTTAAARAAYLEQRRAAREGRANVVEIDLVLQGQPTLDYSREGLPDWDYAVTVTRAAHAEKHEIYSATLQKRLPRFRLPLAADDRDTVLDLQAAFSRCYAEGGYFGWIDYRRDPAVSLDDEDRVWLDALLRAQGLRESQEQVALAAYYLWEREGRPHGRDKEHWHRAVEALRREKGAPPEGG